MVFTDWDIWGPGMQELALSLWADSHGGFIFFSFPVMQCVSVQQLGLLWLEWNLTNGHGVKEVYSNTKLTVPKAPTYQSLPQILSFFLFSFFYNRESNLYSPIHKGTRTRTQILFKINHQTDKSSNHEVNSNVFLLLIPPLVDSTTTRSGIQRSCLALKSLF